MSDTQLVALSMADEDAAMDLVRQLDAIVKLDQNVDIVDAAIATRSGRGKVKLKQLKVAGLGRGGVIGAIGGAFASFASLFHDAGIDDDMMRRAAETMDAGQVALFILYTGDWSRSSAVLQDALLAHGIRYADQGLPAGVTVTAQPASHGFSEEEMAEGVEVDFFEPEPDHPEAAASVVGEAVEPQLAFIEEPEPAFVEEPEPMFGDDSAEELPEFDEEAALAAAVSAAADAMRAADAQAYAGEVQALSDTVEMAADADARQGAVMSEASAQVSEAAAAMGLLSLERRYTGLEVGRMAGELAQIGREVETMPILSALLANRSGVLQRIAADMVASAATARELAAMLDATGGRVGELGAGELDEATMRRARARALAAHAAQVGAAGFILEDQARGKLAVSENAPH